MARAYLLSTLRVPRRRGQHAALVASVGTENVGPPTRRRGAHAVPTAGFSACELRRGPRGG